MKKVLITGNSGYIGSHLTEFLKNDYEVHGLDIKEPQTKPFKHHLIDIRKPFNITTEYDAVVHLAALVEVGESERVPIQYYITNLTGTLNVVNKIRTKNFIFSSTGAAQECLSAYGVSKRGAEDIVREFCTTHRPTPYTIFRFYNVVGSNGFKPTNPDGLMYNLMKARETGLFTIYGNDYPNTKDGTCVRDYVHVMEICESIRTAIEQPSNSIECLGHGVGHTVYEMASIFQDVNSCEFEIKYGPRRKGDIEYYVLDNVSPYMKNLYSIEDLLKVN